MRNQHANWMTTRRESSPTYAGSHSCQAVEECAVGVLRSLGEGGHASAGSAEDTPGTTAVKPWGSTCYRYPASAFLPEAFVLQTLWQVRTSFLADRRSE
jgi:hypothetical protein